MAVGPVQIIAVAFPSTERFEGRIADELIRLSEAGTIRIIDALAVIVEGDEVEIIRTTDLGDEQRAELGAHFGGLIGLATGGIESYLAGADVDADIEGEDEVGLVEAIGEDLIDDLPDDSAALLLIIEHLWAGPLHGATVDAGGVLMANQWMGLQDLALLAAALQAETGAQGDA